MENLEGQYFEKVVSTLKNAKKSETINIRAEFKDELRNKLLNQANGLMLEEQSNSSFFDFILKYKYVFAGVPVLAVMALFSISLFDFKVKIPNEQVIPVTYRNSVNDQNESFLSDNENSGLKVDFDVLRNDDNQKINTFSADLVMPSEEALSKAKERLKGNVDKKGLETNLTFDFANTSFYLPTNIVDQKTEVKVEKKGATEPKIEKTMIIYQYPKNTIIDNYEPDKVDDINSLSNGGMTKKVTSFNALISNEQNNKNLVVDKEEKIVLDKSQGEKENETLSNKVINLNVVDDEVKVDNPKVDNKIKTLDFDTNKDVIPKMKLSFDGVNTKINMNANLLNLNAPLQVNNNIKTSEFPKIDNAHIFSDMKISSELFDLINEAFKKERENLPDNYFIFVNVIGEKQYKVVLFINDQIKNSVVIEERGGKLYILTQIVY